jgi:hypothetical protein
MSNAVTSRAVDRSTAAANAGALLEVAGVRMEFPGVLALDDV